MMNEYSDFKPVDRSRAYTWHGSHLGVEDGRSTASKFAMTVQNYSADSGSSALGSSAKKPWSRRNAWGSMSYADLIGKAIESTADKRMTLSQIYDWMIQNVPYFHDKGTGSSSTGWKNSIRHNLSLHRRFKRVPNEDSGKSSWWMLNDAPDQCPPTRKRTVSVGKFEGKDFTTGPAPPSAKIFRVATEPMQTTSQAGASAASRPWSQTVQPLSGYTLRVPERKQLNWHQPLSDPFYVADLDPAFANPNYTPSSCTPLAPISELLSPQQLPSYDLQAVEIPSPPSYVSIQTVAEEQSSFPGHSLTALSSVKVLDSSLQPSSEMYEEAGPALAELPVVDSASASAEGLQMQGLQWSPGFSMLRQMLSQSHSENARMHGVITDIPSSSAEYSHSGGDHALHAGTTTPLQFVSTAAFTDHSFSYVTLPPTIPESDVLYVQVRPDADITSVAQQPEDAEIGAQQQSVITEYSDVSTSADANAPKTVEPDNNNENVVEEKSV